MASGTLGLWGPLELGYSGNLSRGIWGLFRIQSPSIPGPAMLLPLLFHTVCWSRPSRFGVLFAVLSTCLYPLSSAPSANCVSLLGFNSTLQEMFIDIWALFLQMEIQL